MRLHLRLHSQIRRRLRIKPFNFKCSTHILTLRRVNRFITRPTTRSISTLVTFNIYLCKCDMKLNWPDSLQNTSLIVWGIWLWFLLAIQHNRILTLNHLVNVLFVDLPTTYGRRWGRNLLLILEFLLNYAKIVIWI